MRSSTRLCRTLRFIGELLPRLYTLNFQLEGQKFAACCSIITTVATVSLYRVFYLMFVLIQIVFLFVRFVFIANTKVFPFAIF